MKVKITSLGVSFTYPLGVKGPSHILNRYIIEAEDGRIDTYEEWDEPHMDDGTYEFDEEVVNKLFNKQVELAEDEW